MDDSYVSWLFPTISFRGSSRDLYMMNFVAKTFSGSNYFFYVMILAAF